MTAFDPHAYQMNFPGKQEKFERKIIKELLALQGYNSYDISRIIKGFPEGMTFVDYNESYAPRSLSVDCRKLRKEVTVQQLTSANPEKTEYYRVFSSVRQDWGSPNIAMVFDYHGDGIPPLVLHNVTELLPEYGWFSTILIEDSERSDEKLYIQTWKQFKESFGRLQSS